MKGLIKKVRENKKGFTLAELLVVVAIVGILVAISIPVFTAQLSKARKATNQANLRAAKAAAIADYLTEKSDATDDVTYNYDMTTGGVKVVGENNVTQVASAEVTIDSAASNVKYTKISVKIDPQTSGSDATQTLDGAEITLSAAQSYKNHIRGKMDGVSHPFLLKAPGDRISKFCYNESKNCKRQERTRRCCIKPHF